MKSGKISQTFHPNLQKKKLLNNLQRGIVFSSQSFGISYGSHYGMNSAIKTTKDNRPFFVYTKPQLSMLCLHVLFFPRVLCRLLLVVKLHVMTSLEQTIPASLFVFFLRGVAASSPWYFCILSMKRMWKCFRLFCITLYPVWSAFASSLIWEVSNVAEELRIWNPKPPPCETWCRSLH